MPDKRSDDEPQTATPFRVRLPGFVGTDDVGLGDVVKRLTTSAGVRPCGGCRRRAAALNRWIVITGRKS